jgi:tetratricopeptide (TPR) repeat protein
VATAPRLSAWSRWTFWKVSQIVLVLGVVGWLLGAAVALVLAIIAVQEGNASLFLRAGVGGFVSLGLVWLIGKGVRNAKKRANDLAVAEHAAAIRLDPPDPVAHFNRGFACASKGQYAKAIAHYDAAIRLGPTQPCAYVGRVNAYGAIGQFDRVIAEYAEAIRRDPNDALAYCARATAYNGLGRFDRSIADAAEAIRLAPDLYLGYDARGYGLMQRGNFNAIIKLVAVTWMLATFGFLRRDPFNWRTPTGSKADFHQAVEDFTEALRLNPMALDCYLGRAQVYRALGEHAKAAADELRGRALSR